METATFGGGCFWCLDAAYRGLKGVQEVVSGYAGGHAKDPSYEQVCQGTTGHAEVVRVRFDPAVIPYRTLLDVFFTIHDPTTKDRQGADVGTQYRSIILTHSAQQEKEARAAITELEAEKAFAAKIVTQIAPAGEFYEAEAYHQDYYANNPQAGYCQAVIRPKLAKFRKRWQDRLL